MFDHRRVHLCFIFLLSAQEPARRSSQKSDCCPTPAAASHQSFFWAVPKAIEAQKQLERMDDCFIKAIEHDWDLWCVSARVPHSIHWLIILFDIQMDSDGHLVFCGHDGHGSRMLQASCSSWATRDCKLGSGWRPDSASMVSGAEKIKQIWASGILLPVAWWQSSDVFGLQSYLITSYQLK